MIRTVISSFRKLTYSTFVFHIAEIHIQSWVLQSDSKIKWRMMSKYFIMKTAQRPVIYCSLAGRRKLSFHNSLWWCDSAIPPLIVIISIAGLTNRCLVEASMLMRRKGKLTWDTLVRAPQVRVTSRSLPFGYVYSRTDLNDFSVCVAFRRCFSVMCCVQWSISALTFPGKLQHWCLSRFHFHIIDVLKRAWLIQNKSIIW